ncbi:MAG: PAS domain-containing protein [Erythrobacter sp.]|jgi:PAS domain-containing protein|nr:PAS domain-containing protein [Erythrobacter sp.]
MASLPDPAGLSVDPFLAIIGAALMLVALASLRGVVAARRSARGAARLARERGEALHDLLGTVRMAEGFADLGVWQYEPAAGRQHWSAGMPALFGLEHEESFAAGDAETLLHANDIDLVGDVLRRAAMRDPYTLEYALHGPDGAPRLLRAQVCNLLGEGGKLVRVIAVLRDMTNEREVKRAQ